MTVGTATAAGLGGRSGYASGVIMLVLGTIAFSSAGLFVRALDKDAPTILFWRGLFTVIAVMGFIVWRERGRTVAACLAIGWPGVAIACLNAASMGFFISSIQYTTVANNSIIFGTGPFIVAGLAWLMIRERPSAATLTFSAIAMAGAAMVVGSSFAVSAESLFGDGLALLMTLTFAVKTVLVRKHAAVPMVPSGALGALFGSLGSIPFISTWSVSSGDLALFALFGLTQQGAGLVLTTIGTARVPSAHAALLMALDVPLSPTWVWLVFGERPTLLAFAGGSVVLAAIVGHIIVEGRRRRQM